MCSLTTLIKATRSTPHVFLLASKLAAISAAPNATQKKVGLFLAIHMVRYPLVNVYITMENHPDSWLVITINYFDWAMFKFAKCKRLKMAGQAHQSGSPDPHRSPSLGSLGRLSRYIIIGDTAVGKSCLLLQFTDR